MKNVFTFCCALCLLALTACGSAPKISEEASDLEVNNHEGVTMTVVDGSAYPGQVKVTDPQRHGHGNRQRKQC